MQGREEGDGNRDPGLLEEGRAPGLELTSLQATPGRASSSSATAAAGGSSGRGSPLEPLGPAALHALFDDRAELRRSSSDPSIAGIRGPPAVCQGACDAVYADFPRSTISDIGPCTIGCPRRYPQARWWRRQGLPEEQPRSWAQALARTLSNVPLKAAGPTFQCCICLDYAPVSSRLVMQQCGRASHGACADCMKTYLRLRIEERRVNELRCPMAGDDDCEARVTEEELRAWLPQELCDKFDRFVLMDADPKLRACPGCSRLCSPEDELDGAVKAEMRCVDCGTDFCYYHSNAHGPGAEACAEYERDTVKRFTTESGLKDTKQCPACGFQTEKASGCNHMTCKCKVDWCWICGEQLDNVGWHYNPVNPKGCMQFQDGAEGGRGRDTMMLVCKVLSLPAVAVALAFSLAFVLLLIATCCVPLCCCCKEPGQKAWVAIAVGIVALPFAAFSLAWSIFALVLWCFLLPCGANEVHCQFLVGVPVMTLLAVGEGFSGERQG